MSRKVFVFRGVIQSGHLKGPVDVISRKQRYIHRSALLGHLPANVLENMTEGRSYAVEMTFYSSSPQIPHARVWQSIGGITSMRIFPRNEWWKVDWKSLKPRIQKRSILR